MQLSNPWEIVRNDVTYPVKFYGKVVLGSDGKRKWIGGEDIVAVAYDVPIPGYKTKTTINLRLWSTKAPSDDFDLSSYNSGKHTEAAEALFNAEKVCNLPFVILSCTDITVSFLLVTKLVHISCLCNNELSMFMY